MPAFIPRNEYAAMFGPTTGDRVRKLKENAGFIPDKTQWQPVIRKVQP